MSYKITSRQREVLDYIAEFISTNNYSPTIREIGAAMEIRSTNGVCDHLEALKRKGYLMQKPPGAKSRVIRLSARARALYEGFSSTTMSHKLDTIQKFIDEFPENSTPHLITTCATPLGGAKYVLEVIRKILHEEY